MRDASCMHRTFLVVTALALCACGKQAGSKKTKAAETVQQTHAAVTSQKGEIAQPVVKSGKEADASSLLISFHGCADLLLIDPRGRKLGYDPASQKTYLDIPGGIYDEGNPLSIDDDGKKQGEKAPAKQPDCVADKTVQFPNPVAGVYTLNMSGERSAFKLQITSYGPDAKENGHDALSQQSGSEAARSYEFQLPPSPGRELKLKAK